jgi:mRNA-degrading endonuclease RelE of RelBE toxin-antitoxin system
MKTAQVYFEDSIFEELQKEAQNRNITISELIQELVQIGIKKKPAFNEMVGIWRGKEIDLKDIRRKAWR